MNIHRIQQDFPIFQRYLAVHGRPLVYLDSAATAQKPQVMIDAVNQFYGDYCANVHRALYDIGETATEQYEQARERIAAFINANDASEIIFTKGTTEGINFIADTWALANLKPDDEIVLTQVEHHANLLPWQRIAQKTHAKLVFIPIDPETFILQNPASFIGPKTKLVAISHLSNVMGPLWSSAKQELEAVVAQAKKYGALVLVDAAQSVPHKKVDVAQLGIDFLAFSGHKIFGPTGIGVLYINKKHHDNIQPYQVGGSMVYEATFYGAEWNKSPQKFEAGTPPIAQAIGLGAAIDYVASNFDFDIVEKHETTLCRMLVQELKNISGLRILGNLDRICSEGHIVSFAIEGLHAHDIAACLGEKGIAVRAGHFCAQPLVNRCGFASLVRASLACYNTQTDIELFLQELKNCLKLIHPITQSMAI